MALVLEAGTWGTSTQLGVSRSAPVTPVLGVGWLGSCEGSAPGCVAAARGEWRAGEKAPEGRENQRKYPEITRGWRGEGQGRLLAGRAGQGGRGRCRGGQNRAGEALGVRVGTAGASEATLAFRSEGDALDSSEGQMTATCVW